MRALSLTPTYQMVNAYLVAVALVAGLTVVSPAPAGASPAETYDACLAQTRVDAKAAYATALDWFDKGGGLPARHCAALALLNLGALDEAAARLETIAGEVPDQRDDLRLGLLAQAAQAWLRSGRARRAEELQSLALKAKPDDAELRADRAVTRISLQDYWGAIDDLDIAIEGAPGEAEFLLYRASAYRYLGVADLARDDVTRALTIDPDNPEAWLERGILEQLAGQPDAARRAWIKVLEVAPDGPPGDAARARLEELDVRK